MDQDDDGSYFQLDPDAVGELDDFSLFTVDGLLDILGELSPNKSTGIEDLPSTILFDVIRAMPDIF